MPVAKTDRTHAGERNVLPVEGMQLTGTRSIAQLLAHARPLPAFIPLLWSYPLLCVGDARTVVKCPCKHSNQCEMVETGNSVRFLSCEAFNSCFCS